nr:ImmA/IrrE family metallo-endopeptidase [uncultured Allomuricauda sp.]
MSTRIDISPEKIIWAAERGGVPMDKLFDIFPKAKKWIDQVESPTVKQLEDFSKKVHVPFGFLFLKTPPLEKLPITFYRSNGTPINNPTIEIKDLVNNLKRKQDWLRDYLIENKFDSIPFVGVLKDFSSISIESAAQQIRESLGFDKTWYENTKKNKVFRFWIDQLEKNRVFVISTGFVGNNKRPISVDICKGFTLVDNYCPFIYINTNNLGGGRIFTLLHELVHIYVGKSIGIGYEPIHPSSQPLEKFCDSVASEVLVPKDFFEVSWKSYKQSPYEKISMLSGQFHVSKLVIAKKALDSDFINSSQFWDFYNSYTNQFKDKKSDSGNYWNSKPYEVSRKFYSYVDSALKSGSILPMEAYKLTNMKGNTFNNFRKKAFG